MKPLLRNSRFWILSAAIVIAISIALHYDAFGEAPVWGKLVRTYAFWAAGLLFTVLLITPLLKAFPGIPHKGQIIHARRALGVSSALFATLHAYFAFYKQLGGWAGIPFLSQRYLVAITASGTALLILLLLSATSFDVAVRKLGPLWKKIHKLVYLAGFLILYHALSIGSHFTNLQTPQARLMLLAVFGLLILQSLRMDHRYNPKGLRVGMFTLMVIIVAVYTMATFAGTSIDPGISIHSKHNSNK